MDEVYKAREAVLIPAVVRTGHAWLLFVAAVAVMVAILAVRQMSHSLWFDETQTANIAQAPTLPRLVAKAIHERPYPPLYFLFDRVSWNLRGDEVGLRFPSAVFGALATMAVYFFGTNFFRARTAAVAALLFCLMPGMFRYFIDANPYTLLALTSTLSAWTLWRALTSDRAEDWILYVAAAAAGLACHSLFIFHIGAHFLAGVAWKRSWRWPLQVRFYNAMALVFLIWLSWVVFFRLNGGLQVPIQFQRLSDGNLGKVFLATYGGFINISPPVVFFTWPLLQVAGAATLFLRDKRLFAFLALLIIPPVIGISLFTHATLDFTAYRYGAGIFPLSCLVAAAVLEASFGKLARAALAVVAIVSLAAGASVVVGAPVGLFNNQDWKGVAAFLAENGTSDDPVLLYPSWALEALRYYGPNLRARENMDVSDAIAPNILAFCDAHSDGRNWFIVAKRDTGGFSFNTTSEWKAAQDAQLGAIPKSRLEETGRISLGAPRVFTGISVYPLSCNR